MHDLFASYLFTSSIAQRVTDISQAIEYTYQSVQHYSELIDISPNTASFNNNHSFISNYLSQLKNRQNMSESDKIRAQIQKETNNDKLFLLHQSLIQALKTENAGAEDITQALNSAAWYGLLSGRFADAEDMVREGIALYPENKFLYTNLPPVLLFQGKVKEATELYQQYALQPFGEQDLATYKDAFLDDFKAFEEAGVIPDNLKDEVDKIRKMLEEM